MGFIVLNIKEERLSTLGEDLLQEQVEHQIANGHARMDDQRAQSGSGILSLPEEGGFELLA
jgi:hypothetical protein